MDFWGGLPFWHPATKGVQKLQVLISRYMAMQEDLRREENRKEKNDFFEANEVVNKLLNESINFLNQQVEKIRRAINAQFKACPEVLSDLEMLKTIPAVGQVLGEKMVLLMHEHQFDSAEQVASYIGVAPVQHTSGTSVRKRSRMPKNGPGHIRSTLYMAAMAAIRYNPHCKAVYEKLLKKGKAKMCALGAVMRKLVHLCYGVIKNQKPYDPYYINV